MQRAVASGAIVCAWLLAGCASFEPHPHPYIVHEKLPFTEGALPPTMPLPKNGSRMAVCHIESQAVTPMGSYQIGKKMERQTGLELDKADLVDILCQEMNACGTSTTRLRGDGNVLLLDEKTRNEYDLLLKSTLLCLEYSQHGLKESPYDFAYISVRYSLQRIRDGVLLWQGEVAAYRKTAPVPDSNQQSMVRDALRQTVRLLTGDETFRSALTPTGRQP